MCWFMYIEQLLSTLILTASRHHHSSTYISVNMKVCTAHCNTHTKNKNSACIGTKYQYAINFHVTVKCAHLRIATGSTGSMGFTGSMGSTGSTELVPLVPCMGFVLLALYQFHGLLL